MTEQQKQVSRRGFFRVVGAAGLTGAATMGAMTILPGTAHASGDALAVIAEKVGSGPIAMEKVSVQLPDKAENGALVRVPISVDHPMEAGNFVESVTIIVDKNPQPMIAQFHFTPESGSANVEIRMKMAGPSKVRVIAKSNSGKLYGFEKDVDVAAGGCAG